MAIKKFDAKISKIVDLSSTVRHFEIDLGQEFDYKAGQFVNVAFDDNGTLLRRPYSIASNPNKSSKIELCIKLVEGGQVTPKLFEKKEGDSLQIMGPLGMFTIDKAEKEKVVLIGTGTGLAPLRGMVNDLLSKQVEKEIILIFGCRHEEEILYKNEFEKLETENSNFKYIKIVSRPTDTWEGRTGHVQDNFDRVDPLNSSVFICGLPAMFDGAKEKLLSLGVDEKSIHHEVFR